MRYLIDTSSLSRAVWDDSGRLDAAVWSLGIDQIGVSAMTILEVEYGLNRRRFRRASLVRELLAHFETIEFDRDDAVVAGSLRARMENRGQPIGLIDTLIAAQAIKRGLTVVTNNARDFGRVDGLAVVEL
jgi:tRNA(fMet)-specific endonuclease VapC